MTVDRASIWIEDRNLENHRCNHAFTTLRKGPDVVLVFAKRLEMTVRVRFDGHLNQNRAETPVSNVLFDVVIDVLAPRVDPKGILVREETTLPCLDVLRVSRCVHFGDDARCEFHECIHAFQVCPDAITLIVGRAFQKALGSHQRIHFEVVRVQFGCVTCEHARHNRRPCESIEDTNLIVTENLGDRTFDEVE